MLKVFYNIIILITIPLNLASQNTTVKTDSSDFGKMINNYSQNLSFLINNNLSSDYIVRFIAHPSFDPEYAFQIKKTDNSSYEISTITFRENIWNANNLDYVVKSINRRNISKKLPQKLIHYLMYLLIRYQALERLSVVILLII